MADGEKCNNKDCKTIVTEVRKNGQYKKYCSSSCRRLGIAEKARATSMERYGVSNPAKSATVKQIIKDSFTEKYGEGITNAMDIQKFKDKIVKTNIQRYGTDKPQLLESSKKKTDETNLEKFGVTRPQKLKSLKDKSAETCKARYGVSAPQMNTDIKLKSRESCIEKYGVGNVMQSVEIFERNVKNQLKSKIFKFPSGTEVTVQGYEPFALSKLLESFTENDIIVGKSGMPFIKYFADNVERRYFPDIYIPKTNMIIEVKSVWTMNTNRPRNIAKQDACLDAGYNFKFMIFDKDGNLID